MSHARVCIARLAGVSILQSLFMAVAPITAHAQWTVTSLCPQGASDSIIYNISGDQQVGRVVLGTSVHASLWKGSAESWIDLTPSRAVSDSAAFSVCDGQQVGYVNVTGNLPHASLWSGSAESWVDLNPARSIASVVLGTSGINQVGNALVDDIDRASLWSGTAASWVDLHAILPGNFSSSVAFSVMTDDRYTYVAGFGYNTLLNREEALLWTRPVPAPSFAPILSLGALLTLRRRR